MRRHRERGVAMLEIALVAPIVFLLVFGIIEFGLVFRDQHATQDAVSEAARMGAILGPDTVIADYEIMSALRDGMGGIPPEWIETIVVFRAAGGGAGGSPVSQVPAGCRQGTASSRCNVYDPEEAFRQVVAGNTAYFNCSTNPTGPACSWPASLRDDGPSPATIHHLGVYVRLHRDSLTGVVGSTFTIESASVIRLEPGSVVA